MQRRLRIARLGRSRIVGPDRSGIAWLELLLGVAALALLFQFFPSMFHALIWTADFRNWSPLTWFLVNTAVVIGLIGVRFGPGLAEDWKTRQKRVAEKQVKAEKAKTLKEQREAIERMETSRKRRIY